MRRSGMREAAGWLGALAVAVAAAAQVASTARSELLFRDGDSLVVALFARSVLEGRAADWSMSSVLFLPESAVFAGLDLLVPLDVNGLLAVNAVVNLVALYGALRLAAGARRPGTAPVAWSLAALGAFALLAATETSSSRDALELASLSLTTTYYSSTVVAAVVAVGLARRVLDRRGPVPGLLAALIGVGAVATLTNPLFAVWAGVPLGALLALGALRPARRARMLALLAAVTGGIALGLLGRIPFGAWIANTGAGYLRPQDAVASAGYYAGLLGDRLSTPLGLVGALLTVALLVVAVRRSVQVAEPGARLVAVAAWALPLLVLLGAVAMGTHAARYLQPFAFAPLLALVALPRAVTLPRRLARLVAAAVAVVLVAGAVLSAPRLDAAAQRPDADLACVTGWVEDSGRTGAGQFWTVRLPKLHLGDPSRLVQVDHRLNGYAWLVDRGDFAGGEVTFLVEDAQTVPWELPVGAVPGQVVECGRYRILDFERTPLPLGPAHS